MRIGLVDTESSHVDRLLEFLSGRPDAALVAVAAAQRDLGVPTVARTEDLIGRIDAAVIAHRDGRRHAAAATPLLRAGIPCFVDKPFATTLADAEAMIAAADAGGTSVWSASALRFLPQVRRLAGLARESACLDLVVTAGVDRYGPYSGAAFYAAHAVEVACAILPGEASFSGADRLPQHALVRFVVAEPAGTDPRRTTVTLRLVESPDTPFHVSAVLRSQDGAAQVVESTVPIVAGYLGPTYQRMLDVFDGGQPPVDRGELRRTTWWLEQAMTAYSGCAIAPSGEQADARPAQGD